MTKCHIVQDLLPSYIDGLVSVETENDIHQHLLECEACRALHAKLSAPIDNAASQSDQKEIDFLKKVRKNTTKKLVAGFTVLLLIFATLTYFIAIGSPVSKKDLIYTTHVAGDDWRMNIELTNGKALLVRTEPIYGKKNSMGNRQVVGFIVKPYQLLPSPLLKGENNTFIYGTSLNSFNQQDYKIILRLADGDIVLTSDNYDKN